MNLVASILITLLPLSVGYGGSSVDVTYVEPPETKVSSVTIEEDTYLGAFTITSYTSGFESTGKHPGDPSYGITASGTTVQEGRTIAADWDVLPPGTKVRIEGFEGTFTVEDRGGAVKGNHIDVYMESLDAALEWGTQKREVWIVEEE